MSAEIVNLRRRRKRRARKEAETQAAENRAKYGRPKAERVHEVPETLRAWRAHEATKLAKPDE
jgi:hypothetical protein